MIITMVVMTLGVLVACHKVEPTSELGVGAFHLSDEEIESLKKKASGSDGGDAAFRLSRYYSFYRNDQETGVKWLKNAKNQGHKGAQKEWDDMVK